MKHPLTWGFEKTRVGTFACKFLKFLENNMSKFLEENSL